METSETPKTSLSESEELSFPHKQTTQTDEEFVAEIRRLAEGSLYFFAKYILGNSKFSARIHLPLCKLLENDDHRRLRILLPRSWYKTTLMLSYVLWKALKHPEIRILYCMNTITNAISKLSSIDKHVKGNQLIGLLWPECMPDKTCTWTAEKMCLKRKGAWPEATWEAAGIRTAVVSRHYDIIIEDDTVSPDLDEIGQDNMVPTKEDIGKAIGWHKLALPLLNDPRKSQLVVIGTRWFEQDLLSWIWDNERDFYKHYQRAALEDEFGHADENGDPTFEEQFDRETLAEIKSSLGPYMFSCLYLNKPVRSSEMPFDPSWFQFYEELPRHNQLLFFTAADPAGAPEDTKGEPDWCATITGAIDLITGIIYVVDTSRGKWNPGQHLDCIFTHLHMYHSVKLGFESVALAKAYLHWIRLRAEEEKLYISIEGIQHSGKSKGVRILGLQPPIASGRIKFKRHQRELQTELTSFPYGANDDLVDTLAMLVGIMPVVAVYKKEEKPESVDHSQYYQTFDAAVAQVRKQKGEAASICGGIVADLAKPAAPTTQQVVDQIRTKWTQKNRKPSYA